MNILIKLMSIVSLVIAPTLAGMNCKTSCPGECEKPESKKKTTYNIKVEDNKHNDLKSIALYKQMVLH